LYLYRLIWNRFVASQMPPATFDETTVDIDAAKEVAVMSSSVHRVILLAGVALLGGLLPAAAARADALKDTRTRMEIEAQRVEKEFTEGRALAYKLVRSDSPKLIEAQEKLQTLLATVKADSSLKADRREMLIRTLKWDLDKVQEIADQRRVTSTRTDTGIARATREEARRTDDVRRTDTTRSVTDTARSVIESRSRAVADARADKSYKGDRVNRALRSVEQSAIPETRDMTFHKDWKKMSERRSPAAKLTAKEKAVMKALETVLEPDFSKAKLEDVVEWLKAKLKVEIVVDEPALKAMGLSYDGTEVSLRMKATTRTVLKKITGELDLAYVLKDEAILITSKERAKTLTVTKSYYLGDLVGVADIRLPLVLTQLLVLENAARIINSITQSVDPSSWRVNNPEAVGTISFNPVTMSIVVTQTAENHFLMRGYR